MVYEAPVTWREATLDDLATLGGMNHHLTLDEEHPIARDWPLERLTERMREFLEGEYTAILFEEDGEPVAYALHKPDDDGSIHLRQFFVVRHRRREGLGRRAAALLINEIFPPDQRITLTALCHNETALAFWKAMGFHEMFTAFERNPKS